MNNSLSDYFTYRGACKTWNPLIYLDCTNLTLLVLKNILRNLKVTHNIREFWFLRLVTTRDLKVAL